MPPQCIKILLTACHRPTNEQGENFLKKKKLSQYVAAKKCFKRVTLKNTAK